MVTVAEGSVGGEPPGGFAPSPLVHRPAPPTPAKTRVLHILSTLDTDLPFATALRQRGKDTVSFLLLQEGVRVAVPAGFPVYASRDDCEARLVRPAGAKLLSWNEVIDLMAGHDRVLKW